MPSSHHILCRPLLLLPPIPSSIRVFSNESTLRIRWPKYWSFSFSSIPSKEIPGLISFRMDWLDLLAVRGTLMSLLQHHSSKEVSQKEKHQYSILTHIYGILFAKCMSLLFNMLSRFVIAFLPRSKHLLILWLQSLSAVLLETKKIVFHFAVFPHLYAMT